MQDLSEINLKGKYVVMSTTAFAKALSTIERIFYCKSGFGLDPENSGTKIYGHFVAGVAEADIEEFEECYVRRYDVERLATEEEVQQAITANQARGSAGQKNTGMVNPAYEGAPGMDEPEHPLGEHVQHIVAWVSRHPPLPAQIRMLKAKLGEDAKILRLGNTYTDANAVLLELMRAKATHAVVVLPLSMITRLLNAPEEITWLRAEMMPAHSGACTENPPCEHFNEDTDVLMPSSNGNRHLRFKEFTKLVTIDVITEQWMEE